MMKNLKIFLVLMVAVCYFSAPSFAQLQKPVKWSYAAKRLNATEGILYIRGTIEKGWHIYSTVQPEGGPLKSSFSFTSGKSFSMIGGLVEPKPIKHFEKVFDMDVLYFENTVTFSQKIKLKDKKPFVVKGKLEYMACNDTQCLPPDKVVFSIPVK